MGETYVSEFQAVVISADFRADGDHSGCDTLRSEIHEDDLKPPFSDDLDLFYCLLPRHMKHMREPSNKLQLKKYLYPRMPVMENGSEEDNMYSLNHRKILRQVDDALAKRHIVEVDIQYDWYPHIVQDCAGI